MSAAVRPLPALSDLPDVAVVIPVRNGASTVRRAVESALAQRVPAGLEIAVAVGPSDDGTEEVVRDLAQRHEAVRYVSNPPGTTPAGLNAATGATTAPVIVRLDAHAELPDGYIQTAVRELHRDPTVGNVGGRQVPAATDGFARAVAFAMSSPAGSGGATYRRGTTPADVDTVYLGVFRREALDAVGGFDQSLLRNQDYELNHRLRLAGFTVRFLPELAVAYQPRDTVGGLWRQFFDYGAWKRHVLRLHPGSLRLRQLASPALVAALAAGVILGILGISWVPLLAIGIVYLSVVAVAALFAAGREAGRAPLIVVALIVMHVAWGVGFVVGGAGSRTR